MAETVYKIKNWNDVFEKFNTRDKHRGLDWVSWPTPQDSEAFLFMARTADGHVALGMFGALVQYAARKRRDGRGILSDDKGPLTPERYSARYGLPIDQARAAWSLLSSPQVGWLVPQEAPVCNSDATPMQVGCNPDAIGKERIGEDICVLRVREQRTFDPKASVRLGTVAGQALWDEWCVGSTLPKSNKTASIMAAQRATEFVAEGYWANAGATGSVRDHIDRARDWLRERVSRWRESPLAKKQSESGKIAHATTWFNEQRYNDDDSAWEQTGTGNKPVRQHIGDGSYADGQAVLPDI